MKENLTDIEQLEDLREGLAVWGDTPRLFRDYFKRRHERDVVEQLRCIAGDAIELAERLVKEIQAHQGREGGWR